MKTQSWSDDDVAEAIRKSFCEQFGSPRFQPWSQLTEDTKERWLKMARAGLEVIGL